MYYSRRKEEGSHQARHSYLKKRHGRIRRKQYKDTRLAIKGTWRRVSSARINAIFHMVGVDMARDEKRAARKSGEPIHFLKTDVLVVVNVDDCEEGLRLGDRAVMKDRTSECRDFIIVQLQRNGKMKHIEKSRFALHARGDGKE